ncbi:MAG: hypothetical protein AAF564_00820 [Bacteroidota bacterium]
MLGFADSVSFVMSPNMQDFTNGVYQIRGLLTYSNQKLGLEYKLNSNPGVQVVVGADSHSAKTSEIIRHVFELQLLRELTVKSNLFSCKITAFANSLTAFEKVHGARDEKLVLQVGRSERNNAKMLVSVVQADLSELKLGRLSGDAE